MKTKIFVVSLLLLAVFGFHYRGSILEQSMLLLGGGTRYSDGYSEQLFDEVQVGDSIEKVIGTLGLPLEESSFQNENGDTVTSFEYSLAAADSNYRLRIIFFIDERVSKKAKEIYWD